MLSRPNGLGHLAPGRPVACTVTHSDGTTDALELGHSFGSKQVAWFKAGSALNLL